MTHEYHENLPGFDERQIWKDGCAECEERGDDPSSGMATLDEKRFAYAWKRAADWNRTELEKVGPISEAEAPLLRLLWRLQVMLERQGIPIGVVPGTAVMIVIYLRRIAFGFLVTGIVVALWLPERDVSAAALVSVIGAVLAFSALLASVVVGRRMDRQLAERMAWQERRLRERTPVDGLGHGSETSRW